MQIDELCNLPVQNISNDNCILFLWATFPRLPEALKLIKSWGFSYKGLAFNWVKTNKKTDSLFWGMGYWTRQNPEVCLIGLKGKVPRLARNIHSVLMDKVEYHSKKPDRVRDLIISSVGDLPRIELFARQKIDGWDCWGNEVDGVKLWEG